MLVSVDVLLTEAPMSGDRTRFYRTCEKIRSSPHIEKILRAVRIMVRKYENGMVVFQTRICCTGAFRLITRVFQWRWTNVSWGIFFTKVLVVIGKSKSQVLQSGRHCLPLKIMEDKELLLSFWVTESGSKVITTMSRQNLEGHCPLQISD